MRALRTTLLIIGGVISIYLGYVEMQSEVGGIASKERYGGDAYTGIQNAAAQTSENVFNLSYINKHGFGSILIVGGIALIAFGLPVTPTEGVRQKEDREEENVETETDSKTNE